MSKCCSQKPYDFCIFQGDDHSFSIFYKDPAGDPIDMTGYDVSMQVRADYDSEESVLDLTVGDGITITALDGKTLVEISNAQSESIPAGIYVYDVEAESPAGKKRKLAFGKITIRAEVTKI